MGYSAGLLCSNPWVMVKKEFLLGPECKRPVGANWTCLRVMGRKSCWSNNEIVKNWAASSGKRWAGELFSEEGGCPRLPINKLAFGGPVSQLLCQSRT